MTLCIVLVDWLTGVPNVCSSRSPFVVFKGELPQGTSMAPISSLFVFILRKTPDAAFALHFVNRVDVAAAAADASLHVSIVDGPHVVVYNGAAQELSILALRRRDARFFLWRTGVRVAPLGGDCSRLVRTTLRSCVYVGEDASDEPHLLLHFGSENDKELERCVAQLRGWHSRRTHVFTVVLCCLVGRRFGWSARTTVLLLLSASTSPTWRLWTRVLRRPGTSKSCVVHCYAQLTTLGTPSSTILSADCCLRFKRSRPSRHQLKEL